MKKNNDPESNSTSDESTEDNQDENKSFGKKSEKVMIPFFGQDSPELNSPTRNDRAHSSRKPRFNKSDSYLPRNRSFNSQKQIPQPPPTKEIGMKGNEQLKQKQNKNFRSSYPSFRVKGKKNFNEPNSDDTPGRKIAYIDKSNVGNIRPLSSLYDKPSPKENSMYMGYMVPPTDQHVGGYRQEYTPEIKCPLNNEPNGPPLNFVDALIRNSNTLEDVLTVESRASSSTTRTNKSNKSNKSQELKSVLTKMGILDKQQGPKDLSLKELENDLEKHYVFPKYMTSPDPSSIPIPGSL